MKRTVWILSHSHYDAEVFMIERETLEIGYANLIGVLKLMRSNPTFKFALDQTCFIDPFLKTYPEERAYLQQMVDEGRMEIVGGMHSMPDENIPSGESYIRNVLFAKQYCKKELNVDVRAGWPIDTFGHHPQMPQLMVKCGFDYVAFQRLMKRGSPSEFYWQGIDGSRIFSHWMNRSYAVFSFAPGNLHEFKKFVRDRFTCLESHAVTPHLIAPAGADLMPVESQLLQMVEEFNRSQDDYELVFATPSEAILAMRDTGENDPGIQFQTVTGDLNPAFQGTYSARIAVKQWNRKVETLLTNAEKYDAIAQRYGAKAQTERIWEAWRGVLFNQAHDIICGAEIDPVFDNAIDRFKYSQTSAEACLNASLQAIAEQIDTTGEGIPVVVFNPLGWERSDVVECTVAFSEPDIFELEVLDSSGNQLPSDLLSCERFENGSIKRARVLFITRQVPAFGYEVYRVTRSQGQAAPTDLVTSHPFGGLLRFELDHGWLENEFYRVEFDLWSGLITRLYDKVNQWEVLPEDMRMGNMIVKEQDYGNFWQYNGPCKGDELYPVEGRYPLPAFNANQADFAHNYHGDGNIRTGNALIEFIIGMPFGTGQFNTRVRLYAGLPRIDIQTTLVNQDEKVRYRAALPTSIQDGTITYEIPFGAIERPEGEFPAQNWIDYSKEDRGVTLLNRGLPGNNVVDGVMMLSLMKCTILEGGYGDLKLGPITQAAYEKGKTHIFDYALIPHSGDWRSVQAYRRGAEFNVSLIPIKPGKKLSKITGILPGTLPSKMNFIKISGNNEKNCSIVLSSVKACPGGMIVRLYEAEGRDENVSLEFAWKAQQAYEVNLIEKGEQLIPLESGGKRLSLKFGKFEIRTVKVIF
jgi:alpha-mannosidase